MKTRPPGSNLMFCLILAAGPRPSAKTRETRAWLAQHTGGTRPPVPLIDPISGYTN
jgi:hypothetical protein